jgi:dTDP-4-dehydrorhamnose 3,5-epimerase
MKLSPTLLAGLTVIETAPVGDERGQFVRVACEDELATLLAGRHFRQANLSTTAGRGTVRGMHFQHPPHAEAKLVRCLRGRVFDVAVDLRAGSPTLLQWHALELDAGTQREVFIPPGFAHGFQALSDDVQLLYLHTADWQPGYEGRMRPDDPVLAIEWPLEVMRMSERDRDAPLLDSTFEGIHA